MDTQIEHQQLDRKLLDLAYRKINLSVISALLLASLIVVALWSVVAQGALLLWLTAITTVMALRIFYQRRYFSFGHAGNVEPGKWESGFVIGAAASGLCWGSTVLLFPATPFDPVTVLVIFILAGTTAYACVTMASVPTAAIVFLITALLPLAVWLFSFAEHLYFIMGVITLLYMGVMVAFSRQMYVTISSLLVSTEQNKELTVALMQVKHAKYAEAQKENDRRNGDLFASFEDIIFFVDVAEEGGFTVASINPAAERAFGFKNAEVVGKSKADLFPAALAARLEAYDQACVDSGQTVHYEDMLESPSGNRYFSVTHIPIVDATGKVTRIAAITRDITERKQIEDRLLKSEAQFRMLAENAPDPIYRYDRDCRRIYINPAVEKLTGMPREKLLNKSPMEAMPASSAAQQSIQRVLDTGKPGELEITFTATDGHERTVLNTLVPEFAADGSVETVLCVGRDISARKRMEKILLDSEREYRTLSENLPGNVIRYDRDCRVRYLNKNVEGIFGIPTAYMLGKTPSEVFTDGLFDELELMLQGVMKTGKAVDYDIILPDSSKAERYHRMTLAPEKNERGEVIGVLNIGRDITEQKRYEQELLARAKLEQRLSSYINSAPGFFFSLRQAADGQISMPFASEGIKAIYGLQPQDVAESVVAIIERDHPDDLSKKFAAIEKSGRTLSACQVEFRVLNKELGERWVEARSMPQRDADGTIHWHGFMQDITERKESEEKRFELQRQLQLLSDNLPGAINCYRMYPDGSGKVLYANKGLWDVFGLTPEELAEDISPMAHRIHPDDLPAAAEKMAESMRTHSTFTGEFRVNHPEKGEIWVEQITTPVYEPDGSLLYFGLMFDVTARKAIENALHTSEKMLQEAQRISHIGSWDVDMVNDKLVWSDEIFRIWEIDKTKFKADFAAFIETVHPEDRELVSQSYNDAVINHSLYEVEHRLLFPDGRIKYILERGEPQYDAQGKPVRFIGTSLDITERKSMEAVLQKREREFRSLAENMPDNVARWDLEGRYLYVNPVHERTLGVAASELIGKPLPDTHEHVKAAIAQIAVSGQATVFVRQNVLMNGELQTHDVSMTPERDASGRVVSVLGIGRDMTETYRLQDEVAARAHEFRSLAESSPDNIVRYDREGRTRYLNTSLLRLLGLDSAEEGMGKRPSEIFPDGRFDQLEQAAQQVIESGSLKKIEFVTPGEKGELVYNQVFVVPEFDVNGDIVGTIAFGRDVTAIREAELRLAHFVDNLPGLAYTFHLSKEGQASFPYVSQAVEEIYGLKPADARGDFASIHMLGHPDDRPVIEAAIAESARTMAAFRVESRVCRPGHPERWLDVRSVPEMQPDGSILWYGLMLDITERKQMESALREQADFQGTLLTAMSDAEVQLMLIENGRVIFIGNRALARGFGYTDAEIDAHPALLDFIHPDDRERILKNYQRRLAGEDVHTNYEMGLITKDGERREFDVAIAVVPGTNPVRIVTIGRDVTERKQAELELRESRNFLNKVIDGIADPIFVKDREHRWLLANEAFCNLLGQPREMLIGKSDYDFLPKEQSDVFWEKDEQVFDSGETNINEETITGTSGETRYIQTKKTPFATAGGEGLMVGVIRDITVRKGLENELQSHGELLSSILESSPEMIVFALDRDYRYLSFNRKHQGVMRAIWGKEIAVGMSMLDVIGDHPDREVAKQGFDRALSGENFVLEEAYGNELLSRQYWQNYWAPIRSKDGEVVGLTCFVMNITERKQAERQLAQALEFSEGVINAIPDLLFEVNSEGRYLNVWAQNPELLAAQKELLLGNTLSDVLPPDAAAICMEALQEAAETGLSLGKAIHIDLPHGESWFELSVSKKPGNDLLNAHFLILSRDITERKQVEEALRESREKLSDLFKLSPLGLALTDMQGRYIEFNESFRAICGYPADELMTLDYWTLTPREYEAKEGEQLASLARTGRYGPYEKEYRQKDGTLIPIQLNGTLITAKDGQQYIWSIVEDIRKRKQAEAQLKEKLSRIIELNDKLEVNARDLEDQAVEFEAQAVELEASQEQIKLTEAWYRGIVRSAPDGMVVVNESGNIALVNLNIEKMFGYAEGELIGHPIEMLLPPDVRQGHVAKRDGFFAAGALRRPMDAVVDGLRAYRKDGSEFPVDVSLSRLPDADGKTGVICAAVRDITERKRLEAILVAREYEFRMLVENVPDVVVRYDRECRRTYVNPAWEQVNGVSAEMVIGKTPLEAAVHVKPIAFDYEKNLREVMASGRSREIDLVWRNDAGEQVCFALNAIPEFNDNGEVMSVLTLARDITERKRMEDALAAREYESRTLVNNSPDNISRYNREIRRTFVNQAFAAVVEGGAAALLGKTPTEYPGGPNADLYEAKIKEVFETGENNEFELRWPNNDGREICSHVRLTAERDAAGNVISVLTVGRDITELNEHRKRVYQMAFYDSLTSLPNRALFNDRLRQMITDASWHQQLAGVMLLDLDRFKAVNDTLGHPAGDELLREAAARLSYCVRGYDTVARLGGDEFAILLPEIRSGDDLGRVANKILESFNEPFLLEGKEVFVTSSIGIAVYPADSEDSDDLLKQADSAMYFAKRSGRNNFRFYSKDLTTLSNERLLLEGDLRRGFGRGELELYFQPKVGLADGAMIGSEALLRWNHPQRGMVPPDRFISIAEDCGLIVEIGEWVLRDACRIASEWNGHGKPLHKVAINLSGRQFQSNDLVKTVRKALNDTHCNPEWIELEITESLLLDEDGEVLAVLEVFREMGITIAIDDFGTGYSSLSYLARFPIDTLKIDRSFTSRVTEGGHHPELVKAIISIAHSLQQKVVAEGVETAEQAAILHAYGCHIAQGYLYSKPVPKAAFEGLPRSFGLEAVM